MEKLLKWIVKVFSTFYPSGDSKETEQISTSLIFRYLTMLQSTKAGSFSICKIPLLGMACVIIASKYFETNEISVQELIKRTGGKFTYSDFMQMERAVL